MGELRASAAHLGSLRSWAGPRSSAMGRSRGLSGPESQPLASPSTWDLRETETESSKEVSVSRVT